jgi:hypothetical protein
MGTEFLSGIGQGVAQAQQQKMQMEMLDAQKKLIKAQAKAAEMELEAKSKTQAILGPGIEQMQNARPDGTVPTPYQNAGQPAPTVLDLMTKAAMASGDIGQLMKMQEMQQQAGMQAQTQGLYEKMLQQVGGGNGGYVPSFSMGPNGPTIDINPIRFETERVTGPDQSEQLITRNPYQPGGLPSSPSGAFQTKPPQGAMLAPSSEYANHLDPNTLGVPQGRMTLDKLSELPRVTDEQFKNIQSSKRSLRLLDGIRPLSDKVFSGINDIKEQVKSGVKIKVQSALNQNSDIALYESRRLELLNFVRAIQGAGTITETDAKAASAALADLAADKLLALPDTEKTAQAKMDLLEKSLGASIMDVLGEDAIRGPWRGESDGWGIVE